MFDRDRIDQIIDIAAKEFKTGQAVNQAMTERLATDPTFVQKLHQGRLFKEFQQGLRKQTWLQYRDEDYPKYCANKIHQSLFVAGFGPKDLEELEHFFDSHFRNKIANIICLGSDEDFINYYTKAIETDKYSISPKIVEEKSGAIITELTVIHKERRILHHMKVHNFRVADNGALDLPDLIAKNETQFLQILLNLSKTTLTEPHFVHCKFGVGRTGFLIFLLKLLQNFDDIFKNKENAEIAKNIHKIFTEIRQNRPALVTELSQFRAAIKGAYCLHHYAKQQLHQLVKEADHCLKCGDQLHAQEKYFEALKSLTDHESQLAGNIYRKLGDSFRDLGDKVKASRYYLKALPILQKYEKDHRQAEFNILIMRGNMSHMAKNYNKAILCYDQALLLPLEDADKARTLRKIGDVYRDAGNYQEAELFYQKDLAICKDEMEHASTYRKLGMIYQAINDKVQAIDYYEKALFIKRKYSAENPMTLVNILNVLGSLYCELNEADKAIAVLNESISIIKTHLGDFENRYLADARRWLEKALAMPSCQYVFGFG